MQQLMVNRLGDRRLGLAPEVATHLRAAEVRLATPLSAARRSAATHYRAWPTTSQFELTYS